MSEELSLLDIAPVTETVAINEMQKVKVYGLSAAGIMSLLQRFPEVKKWFRGAEKMNLTALANEMPTAFAAVIAAGCGEANDPKAEQIAASLAIEQQIDILEAIGRLTFTRGFGPFTGRLTALARAAEAVNFGRALDTKSPPPSSPALPPDMTAQPPGE